MPRIGTNRVAAVGMSSWILKSYTFQSLAEVGKVFYFACSFPQVQTFCDP